MYFIKKEINHACELACDEAVIKDLNPAEKQGYGDTLISVVSENKYPMGILQVTMSEEKETLKERLVAIMKYNKKSKSIILMSIMLLIAFISGAVLLGACSGKTNQNVLIGKGAVINVSLTDQSVRIYRNGALIKEFAVSTGTDDSTPTGDFEIQNRGEWFFSEKYQEGAKWWVSFKGWGEYLFHSIPMDRDKQILTEEADKLGSPASHGCIRLAVEDAKWIYDNIPQGTTVHIE